MRAVPWLLIAALTLAAAGDAGQIRPRGRGGAGFRVRMATPADFDGKFHFCRVAFGGGSFRGSAWGVDFPRADVNLSIRLSELTRTDVAFDERGEPVHFVVRLTDEAIFHCPFLMMTEVGTLILADEEAARLRDYLLKGGFLWADDFWGFQAWRIWEHEIRKVLPAGEYPIVDLPRDHALFRSLFEVKRVPQIPSINFWAGTGGDTSEWGAESETPYARAILDREGRIIVLVTYNTDIGDSWEREGDDPRYFYEFSVEGYAFGLNAVVYAFTH
ncbi:MAG: DUF4159 domain-containing protein [Acidobacteriota bacterium]